MSLYYDFFTAAFLAKITDYDLPKIPEDGRTGIVDGYMMRTLADFRDVCSIDFLGAANNETRQFDGIDIDEALAFEIQDIVADGMVCQWLRPYLYHQELLQLSLNTKDWSTYSSANLLSSVNTVYQDARRNYINRCREYSYRHGDLTDLHI